MSDELQKPFPSQKPVPSTERKRAEILEAAWRVFSEQGYGRASMTAVQTLWGGSEATMYSYFGSKEELFSEAVSKHSVEISATAFEVFDDSPDLEDALMKFGRRYLNFHLHSDLIDIARLASVEGKALEFGTDLFERAFRCNWTKVAGFLEKHLDPERLLPGGSWRAGMHLKGLLDGDLVVRRLWGLEDKIDAAEIEEVVHSAVAAFLRVYR